MILTTTNSIENKTIKDYKGLVTGETIFGANIIKDFMAGVRDIVGGRSGVYEKTVQDARETSLREMEEKAQKMGANAVIGIDFYYETIGTMLMVSCSGTAVFIEE